MTRFKAVMATAFELLPAVLALPQTQPNRFCRYLSNDAGWPTLEEWARLNATVGGNLIRGEPLAQSCYRPEENVEECLNVQNAWDTNSLYFDDPVNVMSPYWLNNSCSPFLPTGCTLGNIASYAIKVTDAASVISGIKFAQDRNIRLTIKNTGHDYLGRSSGKSSLALWTHNLKNISITDYNSSAYSGPAIKIGAGVQSLELAQAAAKYGLRVVGGYCPTVGVAGGYSQNGGYGPLASLYGLAADNILEFDVVTTDGQNVVASPSENPDLYWALSGGGSGNYAVVLSQTIKAHADGQTAGTKFSFVNTNSTSFWAAIKRWYEVLPGFNLIPGLTVSWLFTKDLFTLIVATLPGGNASDIDAIFTDFYQTTAELNITLSYQQTVVKPTYVDMYSWFVPPSQADAYPSNNSIGGRLIPASVVRNNLTHLLDIYRLIVEDDTVPGIPLAGGATNNVSYARTGTQTGSNSVLPAWRDALFILNAGVSFPDNSSVDDLRLVQAKLNSWQDAMKALTPGGGSYVNEATYDNPDWKWDYYGENYGRLLQVKEKYDPSFTLWQHVAVGADVYWEDAEGRLCRI